MARYLPPSLVKLNKPAQQRYQHRACWNALGMLDCTGRAATLADSIEGFMLCKYAKMGSLSVSQRTFSKEKFYPYPHPTSCT